MRFRLPTFAVCIALAVLGGLLLGMLGKNKARYRTIHFDAPKAAAAGTNSQQSASRKNGLLQLEEDLSRSFSGLKPSSPMEEMMAPTLPPRPAPAVPNRRAKELQDRRKNWIFAKPEDLRNEPTMEELLNLPEYDRDGQETKSLSSVERYYQDLIRRDAAKASSKSLAPEDPFGTRTASREDTRLPEDSEALGGIRKEEQELRKLLGADMANFAPAPVRGSLSDIFGFGDQGPSPEEELAHKAYLKEFQQWLDGAKGPATPGGLPSALAVTEGSRQPFPTPGGLDASSPSGQPNRFGAQAGMNPALTFGTLPDVNAKVLNQWNPFYVPPKVEPPRVTPPAPTFESPRRKF